MNNEFLYILMLCSFGGLFALFIYREVLPVLRSLGRPNTVIDNSIDLSQNKTITNNYYNMVSFHVPIPEGAKGLLIQENSILAIEKEERKAKQVEEPKRKKIPNMADKDVYLISD